MQHGWARDAAITRARIVLGMRDRIKFAVILLLSGEIRVHSRIETEHEVGRAAGVIELSVSSPRWLRREEEIAMTDA